MNTTQSTSMTSNNWKPRTPAIIGLGGAMRARRVGGIVVAALGLFAAAFSHAQSPNVPTGLTGLWRFQNTTNLGAATIGYDLMFSNAVYGTQFLAPWTDIGVETWHTKYSDGYAFQESTGNYLAVNPGFTPNGGGDYVNEYTIAIDYVQTMDGWNSLFQTAYVGTANDGDLWIDGENRAAATIYTTELGYSAQTFDASKWHRIVWSIDNANFYRVYVDGTLFLDGPGQGVDGRYSLYPDRFNLFADNNGEDLWGLVGTVATWNRALSSEEIAAMGGWIGTNEVPTPLIFSETTTNTIPIVTFVSPANGETNVAPGFAYQASILDSSTATVDQSSVKLLLDGLPVSPAIASVAGAINVTYSSGGLLPPASTHKYTLTFDTTGVVSSFTNEVTFTAQNYTSYEWGFNSGDLSIDLGNGTMSYVAGPAGTTFGTTDGSTVPHINGTPATYMHVPAFSSDTDGIYLVLSNSGPNVGTNAYINRYSAIFDILIPTPVAGSDWMPFFNTDPYNLDDADFYYAGDGTIGIGGGGYSAPGTIAADTWYRIAFVADLKANTLTYYVNGANVKSRAANGLGGQWSIKSIQDVGAYPLYPANLLLFNEGDTSGVYTHDAYVSSVAFCDRVLSAGEIAALGGPKAAGIFIPSLSPAPALTIQSSGGGAVLSWPSNYVGYVLQQSATLTTPQWVPAGGVTNNSVNLPAGEAARFFRLVQ